MISTEKEKIHRFILGMGEHIQDTTEVAAVSMEHFSLVVRFAKNLELKRQKRMVDKEKNKKARTTSRYSGELGGGGNNWLNKGTSAPTQSTPQFSKSTPSR